TIGHTQTHESGSVGLSADTATRAIKAKHDRLVEGNLTVAIHYSMNLIMLEPYTRSRDDLIQEVGPGISLFLVRIHDGVSQDLDILMPRLARRHMNHTAPWVSRCIAVRFTQCLDQLIVVLDIVVRRSLAVIIVQARSAESSFLSHSPVSIGPLSYRILTVVESIRSLDVSPAHLRHVRRDDVHQLLSPVRGNPRLCLVSRGEDASLTLDR